VTPCARNGNTIPQEDAHTTSYDGDDIRLEAIKRRMKKEKILNGRDVIYSHC